MKRDGLVFQQIFEGECFGTTEFIERTVSGRFTAVAACKTHVLQLLPDAVRAIVSPDTVHASLFYWTLCQVCDCFCLCLHSARSLHVSSLIDDVQQNKPSRRYTRVTYERRFRSWTSTSEKPWRRSIRAPGRRRSRNLCRNSDSFPRDPSVRRVQRVDGTGHVDFQLH